MFSYRHAFHAGNHADVLKHIVLMQILHYFAQKEAPYMYIDTHAGAAMYALDGVFATKSGEAKTGIDCLWDRKDLPAAALEYVNFIKALNPSGKLRYYPGSPCIADKLMRDEDRLRLFEMHPADAKILVENFNKMRTHDMHQGIRDTSRGKRVMIQSSDGFAGLIGLLPPPSRRGLVLIDPSYEDKLDYRRVKDTLKEALLRFSTGTYAVWYPALSRMDSHQLPLQLKRLTGTHQWLHVTLTIGEIQLNNLRSSGMFVINPPWVLEAALKELMPYLVSALGVDAKAAYTLEVGDAKQQKRVAK